MPVTSSRHWLQFSLGKLLIVLTVLSLIGAVAFVAAPKVFNRLKVPDVAVHQRGVTRELSLWEAEYSQISDDAQAKRAQEMLDFIRGYHLPGDKYRSDPETEKRLEDQRSRTLQSISTALEAYIAQSAGRKSPNP